MSVCNIILTFDSKMIRVPRMAVSDPCKLISFSNQPKGKLMNGIFGSSNNIFSQASSLLQEQQRVGLQSAEFSAASGSLQQALQALSTVARNIRN
ncbi:hypothetical protein AB833_17475 [Chromatiales bacterium (ex Bugula neritina AB1)]|nr:hypothetical protein AB833_17475 [Chromatiales bacterium (ex Bugula neritina AB1)]